MLRIKPFGSRDANAIHTDGVNEFSILTEITSLDGNEMFVLEWPNDGYAKRKIKASNLQIAGADPTAFHSDKTAEFLALDQKVTPIPNDILAIEDSAALYGKKYVTIGSLVSGGITIDTIGDGVVYSKVLFDDNTKLAAITSTALEIDGAVSKAHDQGTDTTLGILIANVDLGTNLIKNSGTPIDPDDLVPKTFVQTAVDEAHAQGTDTTLGIMTQAIDMGTYKITNAADPDDPQDLATKNYVDTVAPGDPDAFHKTISSEISALIQKTALVDADYFLLEDSEDTNSKKGTTLQYIHETTNLDEIQDGITFKLIPADDATKLASISSSAVDIDDAVSKRHTQGTDTTLGIMSQDIDMGVHKVTNATDPDDPQDLATKFYVDNSVGSANDPEAFHKNISNEFTLVPLQAIVHPEDHVLLELNTDGSKVYATADAARGVEAETWGTGLNIWVKRYPGDDFNFLFRALADSSTISWSYDVDDSLVPAVIEAGINLDNISDGTIYKKIIASDATKLSSISSSAVDIDDAVSKRHTQGTDTTLGIMTANIDMGTHLIRNLKDPLFETDAANFGNVAKREGIWNQPVFNKKYTYSIEGFNAPVNFTPGIQYTYGASFNYVDYTITPNQNVLMICVDGLGSNKIIFYSSLNRFDNTPASVTDYVDRTPTAIASAYINSTELVIVGMTGDLLGPTPLPFSTDGGYTFPFGTSLPNTHNVSCFYPLRATSDLLIGTSSAIASSATIQGHSSGFSFTIRYTAPANYKKVVKILEVDGELWAFINSNSTIYQTIVVKSTDNGNTWSLFTTYTTGDIYNIAYCGAGVFVASVVSGPGSNGVIYRIINYFGYSYQTYDSGLVGSQGGVRNLINIGGGKIVASYSATPGAGNGKSVISYNMGRTWGIIDSTKFGSATSLALTIPLPDLSLIIKPIGNNDFYRLSLFEKQYKSHFIEGDHTLTLGFRDVRTITGSGTATFNFDFPEDFNGFGTTGNIYMVGIVSAGAALSDRNIDLSTEYDDGPNSIYNQYSQSDTTTLYDLTGTTNKITKIPFKQIVSNAQALTTGAIEVVHSNIGGNIYYLGVQIIYQ